MKKTFNITGMTCAACSAHVEKAVSQLAQVNQVNVNLLLNNMQVDYDDSLSPQDIISAVEKAGYGASIAGERKSVQDKPTDRKSELKKMKHRLIFSICMLIPLMYVAMHKMLGMWFNIPSPPFLQGNENAITFSFLQFLLLIPILIANQKYFIVGFKRLFAKAPNMDSLIAIGAGAATVYGIFAIFKIGYGLGHGDMSLVEHYSHDIYFESAGTILTLITVGKYMEEKSKGKTSEAISKLMDLAPKTAIIERNGQEITVAPEDIAIGDIVIIKPGSSIPVDGVIIEGQSSIDQSAVTGESIPVEKNVGDTVISAGINKLGAFKMQATRVGEDTTLNQIIALVEQASASKAPIAQLADKISGIFVPVVITIALIAFVVWLILGKDLEFALSIGIAVLVVSCPCALGLATPVAIMVGTGKGAENGILIKSGEALQSMESVTTVVMDKTGTITQGKPQVTDVIALNTDEQQLLSVSISLEQFSEHPLAEAIRNKGKEMNLTPISPTDFKAVSGRGIQGKINNKLYFGGNLSFIEENNISYNTDIKNILEKLSQQGKTPLIFANSENILGIIAVADIIKPDSKQAVDEFKKMGINVIMLTGDNKITGNAIGKKVGIDKVVSQVMPADKERIVSEIMSEGQHVAMIGDGINDAPALVKADVGVAIGAGTDVAIESADIVLMKSSLLDAVTALKLSKAVIKNIKQNLFWAFFYNSIGIPLAAGVLYGLLGIKLNPMFGAAAMSLSSFCVVSNALRLKLFKVQYKNNNLTEERNEDMLFGGINKTMIIEGMMCGHCSARVEKALGEIQGVEKVKIDLEKKTATVKINKNNPVEDNVLKTAVEEAGYKVIEIK